MSICVLLTFMAAMANWSRMLWPATSMKLRATCRLSPVVITLLVSLPSHCSATPPALLPARAGFEAAHGVCDSVPDTSPLHSTTMAQETPLSGATAKVQDLVSKHPLVIFSKTYCPYSRRVKSLFSQIGASGVVVELDEEADGTAVQNALASLTGKPTVPSVFIGGRHIGGADDAFALHGQGSLVPMLEEAGALKDGDDGPTTSPKAAIL